MIIPKSNIIPKPNDIIINTETIRGDYYMIPPGHEFILVEEVKGYSQYIVKDKETNITFKHIKTSFTKKITIDEAIEYNRLSKNKMFFIQHIKTYSKHKTYGYDDRDRIDICKIGTRAYNNACIPNGCKKYKITDNNTNTLGTTIIRSTKTKNRFKAILREYSLTKVLE